MFNDLTSSEILGIKWIKSFKEYEYNWDVSIWYMLVSSFSPAQGGHPSVLINLIPSGDHLVPSYLNDG